VGLRVPSDPIAQALITEFEKISNSAIAAPSANRFGQVSPTSGSDVLEELGQYLNDEDQILDGGNSTIGIESTIIDCTRVRPRILRNGTVTKEDMKFSGSFEKHYAPKCKVVIDFEEVLGAGFLALSDVETPIGMVRLASPKSVEEFAHILYSTFRKADHQGIDLLIVCLPKGKGILVALRERLLKASQGR
jgi:L-threonylcarbamoyladenylate synthase